MGGPCSATKSPRGGQKRPRSRVSPEVEDGSGTADDEERPPWEEGYHRIKKILRHRALPDGERSYQVEWAGQDPRTGAAWDTWWLPKEDITTDMVEEYEKKHVFGIPSKMVTVDAAVAYHVMRRSVAHALMFGAPKATGFQGRNRPRVHEVNVPLCGMQQMALGVLDLFRKHGGPALDLLKGNQGGPGAWWQVQVKDLERIASFCEFQSFLDHNKAIDNMRIAGTSKHNGDVVVVGQPLLLTIRALGHTDGIVDTKITFPTIAFNGATGQPVYPHMSAGMLKRQPERAKLIKHVRARLPAKHKLAKKGWCELPEDISALALEYAVPDK